MYLDILKFWFEEIDSAQWWMKDKDFDNLIIERFSDIHAQAARCELYEWRSSAQGRLAEIIILDQFSRNMFRNSSLSFANDSLALVLSQEAISAGADAKLTPIERGFLYMPFMHSESLFIHDIAVGLYERNGIENNLDFEIKHKVIIEKFGRYPHRNYVLGRESTAAELEFLKTQDSEF